MKLEQKDKSMLFSKTEIPDIFFTEYLTCANSDSIKVYLCLIFLSKYGREIKLNDLSKKLNLPINVIQSSLTFWEEQGVLTKKINGYILNDLQEIELHKSYSPNLTLTPEAIEKNEKNQYRAKAIESINARCFQGVMSPSWYSDIDLWFKKYEFDEQVMIALFDYCNNKSALHKNYVQTVADAWNKSKIKTYDDLESYYERYEKIKKIKNSVAKKLRRYTPLTQFEEAYIEKWVLDYNYNLDIINIALKKTTSKANPSFDYLDKLLSDWHDRNLVRADEIEKFLSEFKQKNKNAQELAKKTNYNNYEQRSYDNLDNFYANKKVN
ncbi:MAG: DnaD domain protein [Clostridia bacterium]|nr:DnaD domain protein [Clostridia bacterium]